MAFIDNSLVFSSAQAITTTAASTNTYDVAGAGYGNAINQIIGKATVFGEDIGAGDNLISPSVMVDITTTFVGSGASLTIAIQSGVDNGSNAVSTWTTIADTGAIPVASLTVSAAPLILRIPPRQPGTGLPRFYRLYYTVTSGPFTGGVLSASIVTGAPTLNTSIQYPANFTAA